MATKSKNKIGKLPEGIVNQIKYLYSKGKTQKEIIEAGYNRNTVYRQCLIAKSQAA